MNFILIVIYKMYELARQGGYQAANMALPKLSPYASMYELNTGDVYPWLGQGGVKQTSDGMGVGFGARPYDYTVRNGRIVKVYRKKAGRAYDYTVRNGRIVKVYRKKAKKRSKRKSKKVSKKKIGYTLKKNRIVLVYKFKGLSGKRYSNKRKLAKGKKVYKKKSQVKQTRKRTRKSRFGGSINPAIGANYLLNQYATNSATPNLTQLERLAGFNTVGGQPSSQIRAYHNLNGMGF